jgi:hypothetical protein
VTVTVPPTPAGWGTTPEIVGEQLGPGSGWVADDPGAVRQTDAGNRWCWRKRFEAGYVDTPADGDPVVTDADVVMGCTLYVIALWRERQSTDGYASFEDFPTSTPVGGSLGQIRRLLGVPKARTDAPPTDEQLAVARARRRALRR